VPLTEGFVECVDELQRDQVAESKLARLQIERKRSASP
jgi:hypothetical protein